MNNKLTLTIPLLMQEANAFALQESQHQEPLLYGITDGKAVGTYLEQKFRVYLQESYTFAAGNSAAGIDFPSLQVDIKSTSVRQPQSSCPFRSARQKVYGLGYALLVFVYEKQDDPAMSSANLLIRHRYFCREGTHCRLSNDDRIARACLKMRETRTMCLPFLSERMLPVDDIQAEALAQEILQNPPEGGLSDYLECAAMAASIPAYYRESRRCGRNHQGTMNERSNKIEFGDFQDALCLLPKRSVRY